MLRNQIGPMSVMGFARYEAKEGVEAANLIAAAHRWQKEFLAHQPGIAMHCFLGNSRGHYADAILATDAGAFAAMAEEHMQAPSSQAFMKLLRPDSIRLCRNDLMNPVQSVPAGFAAIEFGTFRPKHANGFTEDMLRSASDLVERDYLARDPECRLHLMARAGEGTYSEICFVETEGAAREICGGYLTSEACAPLLGLMDPESVDLDFWHVLA